MNARRKIMLLLASAMLIAGAVVAADGDERFLGGIYDGYDQNFLLDVPVFIPGGLIFKLY